MPGLFTSTQNTQQQQQSKTDPWAPSQPALNSLLSGIGNLIPGAAANGAANGAFNTMASNAAATPNYTPQANAYTSALLSGGPDLTGGVNSATSNFNSQMSPYLQPGYTDPMNTPGLSNALNAVQAQVGNSINGQFAAAGRDLSPANSTATAYGETQAMAPLIMGQYNQNVQNQQNAAQNVYGAGINSANTLSGLNQTSLGNQLQGFNFGTNLAPTVANNGATQTLNAASAPTAYGSQNLGMLEGLTVPIAGLGGQSSGTSNSQGTQTMSPWQAAMMGLSAWGSMSKSDRRAKDNVEQVGELFDGTPVYRYNYIGETRTQIGLIAQEVELYAPDAVRELDGIKHVDYLLATERAADMGAR